MQKTSLASFLLACVAHGCRLQLDQVKSSLPLGHVVPLDSSLSLESVAESSRDVFADSSEAFARLLVSLNVMAAFSPRGPGAASRSVARSEKLEHVDHHGAWAQSVDSHDSAETDVNVKLRRSILGWIFSSGAAVAADSLFVPAAKASQPASAANIPENEKALLEAISSTKNPKPKSEASVSLDDFKRVLKQNGYQGDADKLFKQLDVDGSGELSLSEVPDPTQAGMVPETDRPPRTRLDDWEDFKMRRIQQLRDKYGQDVNFQWGPTQRNEDGDYD